MTSVQPRLLEFRDDRFGSREDRSKSRDDLERSSHYLTKSSQGVQDSLHDRKEAAVVPAEFRHDGSGFGPVVTMSHQIVSRLEADRSGLRADLSESRADLLKSFDGSLPLVAVMTKSVEDLSEAGACR